MARKKIRLGDICDILNGYAFKSDKYVSEGIRIIRIANVQKGYLEDSMPQYYPLEASSELHKYILEEGDLLMSLTGNVGRVACLPANLLPAALNQRVACLRLKDSVMISKDFLFQFLNSDYFESQCILSSKGIAQKNMSTEWLKEYEIPFFSPKEQQKISSELSRIDALIALEYKQLAKLDELVKSRFVEMFGDPSSNPMGWKETTVGAECYYIKDGPHKSLLDVGEGNGYPFISVRNIVNGHIDFSTAKYISEEDYLDSIKKCHPQKGDMLYSKGGTTGIAKLIDVDVEFANWVHVAVLKFDDTLNGVFFENMLNCEYCYDQSQRLTKGIANRDLVLSAMAQIKMYKPPLELQEKFASFVEQTNKSKLAVKQSLEKLETLKKSLMQQYFG